MSQPLEVSNSRRTVYFDQSAEPPVFTDVSYDETDYIGSGALGQVYRGEGHLADDGSPIEVVVKIPVSVDKYDEAKAEHQIFAKLRHQIANDHPNVAIPLPETALGTLTATKIPVLVLPFFGRDKSLAVQVRQQLEAQKLIAAELMAVRAAIDFTYAMEALHSLGSTCTDRKVPDFFYDAANRQSFVIDWNVLRSNDLIYRVGEIRQFASLWHELFIERKGVPPFDPYNDLKWQLYPNTDTPPKFYTDFLKPLQPEGVISVGLRVILAQAIDFEPNHPKHRQFAVAGRDYFAVLRDQLSLWESTIQSGGGSSIEIANWFGISPVEAAGVVADLNWRIAPSPDTAATRGAALKAVRTERRTELEDSRNVIEDALKIDLDRAQREVERLKKEFTASEDWENWSHIRRWELLFEVERNVNFTKDTQMTRAFRRSVDDLGLALHRPPNQDTVQDLETAENLLSVIQAQVEQIASDEVKRILNQVGIELRIRHTVLTRPGDRTASLSNRQQAIKDLDILLNFEDRGADSYLDGPDDLTLQQRIGRTLLRKLLIDYDLVAWIARIDEFMMTRNPLQIYETFQLLETAQTSDSERGLLRRSAHSLIDLARFADHYTMTPPHEETLPVLLRQAGELKDQVQNAQEYGLRDVFDRVINPVVRDAVERAVDAINHALQTRVQPAELERLAPVVDALKAIRRDLSSDNNTRLQSAIKRFDAVLNQRDQWRKELSRFLAAAPSERPAILVKLSELLTQIENARSRGIDMSDLIGNLDEQREYLNRLDEVMKMSVAEAEEKIANLRKTLEAHASKIERSHQSFQKVFKEYRDEVGASNEALQAELKRQRQAVLELDIQRAWESFDLSALQAIQRSQQIEDAQTSEKLNRAIEQLQSLQANPTLQQIIPYGVLAELHEIRDQLRRGAIDAIDESKRKLFSDPEVAKLAVSHSILAGVIDLYWAVQVARPRNQGEGAVIRAEFEQRADQQVKATRKTFEAIRQCFNRGEYDNATDLLQTLTREYNKIGLADTFARELIAGWRYRIETSRRAQEMIMWLRGEVEQLDSPLTLERAGDLMDGLVLVMQNCPTDCFNDDLYNRWKSFFDHLRTRITTLIAREEAALRVRDKPALLQWRDANERAFATVDGEAASKASIFKQIYALGGGK